MNPYNSIWTGVDAGDGPRVFHVVLMDNARTEILADAEGRQTLNCIRCGACQNACPVYRQTGGHAYGSVYAGPIGAILTPQLQEMHHAQSLPYASSLCGACYEVCPVKINIPEVLIHLRAQVVEAQDREAGLRERLEPGGVGGGGGGGGGWGGAGAVTRRPRSSPERGSCRWPAAARSPGCPGSSAAGPRPATCPPFPARASASGGERRGGRERRADAQWFARESSSSARQRCPQRDPGADPPRP